MAGLTQSTIGRKFLMALSAMFLLVFLLIHLSVNLLSIFSEDAFNTASHFMGYNPLIQFVMQPVLVGCNLSLCNGLRFRNEKQKRKTSKICCNK